MTIYKIIGLYEANELYEAEIENLDECIVDAEKRLKDEEEEIEFYGITQQREENKDALRNIVSILNYKKEKLTTI